MPKQTSYELLKDVHKAVNRLDDKMDTRMTKTERKVDLMESKMDKMAGKIGIAVMFVTVLFTGAISLIFDFIKDRFFK